MEAVAPPASLPGRARLHLLSRITALVMLSAERGRGANLFGVGAFLPETTALQNKGFLVLLGNIPDGRLIEI